MHCSLLELGCWCSSFSKGRKYILYGVLYHLESLVLQYVLIFISISTNINYILGLD